MKFQQTLFGFVLSLGICAAMAVGPAPDAIVKSTVQEVMNTLRTDSKVTQEEAIKLVQAKVFPHFDFKRLTAQAMGKHWAAATPEQQEKLAREFQIMLARAYVNQLIANRDSSVDVKSAVYGAGNKDATVTSDVTNPKTGQSTSLTYAFSDTANGWKVGNVSVDGVSLVTSYRNSFNNVVRQNGVDGLLQKIIDKNAQASK